MRFLYNILFAFFFVLSAPYYFLKMRRRGNWQKNFGQRFGRYNGTVRMAITNRHILWLHAVSVGEVNICTQLIRVLEPQVPNLRLVVSTTTSTGMAELEKKLPSHILKIYFPIDFPRYVKRALAMMNPVAIVLVEAEIWPNFLWQARKMDIPIFLANARLSRRSYWGYRQFQTLFRGIFANFTGIGCQNEEDAAKLRRLGCRPEAVKIVGNMKYDAAKLEEKRTVDVPALLRHLGVKPGTKIIVAGSTHDGEEKLLAGVYQKIRAQMPGTFLVVVPRHFERAVEARQDILEMGIKCVLRTEIVNVLAYQQGEIECLIVNTTGELKFFYEFADVVFVGKSLTAEGGQNPLEPGALGKPILFGPNMQNFAAIADSLVARGGARVVHDPDDLQGALEKLLRDENHRAEMGRNAQAVIRENLGAVERTSDMILEHLRQYEVYVTGK